MERDREFQRVSSEKGLEGWMSFLVEDAIIFPVGREMITGKDAIKAHYEEIGFHPSDLEWNPVEAEVAESGDLGYTIGTWSTKSSGSDAKGKYTTIWQKDPSGVWKVKIDIGCP